MKIERVQPVSGIKKELPKRKEEPNKKPKAEDTFEKSPELQELLRRAEEK